MKNKLLVVCLAAILIAGGCAETKPMGESSEAKESDVVFVDSQIVESREEIENEGEAESTANTSELSEDSGSVEVSEISVDIFEKSEAKEEKSEQPKEVTPVQSEVFTPEASNPISIIEEIQLEDSSETIVEEVVEERVPEVHEEEHEYSTIPNSEAIIRYNPPESSSDEKWWYELDGTEESEEEIQIWAITQCQCTTCDGDIIDEGTYVRVLWNDLDDEYCVIQWYDTEENISEHGLQMFEIYESDTYDIITNKKTAGIITS